MTVSEIVAALEKSLAKCVDKKHKAEARIEAFTYEKAELLKHIEALKKDKISLCDMISRQDELIAKAKMTGTLAKVARDDTANVLVERHKHDLRFWQAKAQNLETDNADLRKYDQQMMRRIEEKDAEIARLKKEAEKQKIRTQEEWNALYAVRTTALDDLARANRDNTELHKINDDLKQKIATLNIDKIFADGNVRIAELEKQLEASETKKEMIANDKKHLTDEVERLTNNNRVANAEVHKWRTTLQIIATTCKNNGVYLP